MADSSFAGLQSRDALGDLHLEDGVGGLELGLESRMIPDEEVVHVEQVRVLDPLAAWSRISF